MMTVRKQEEMLAIRKQEEKCFMRAFRSYILPFVKASKTHQVILKKDNSKTVYFEFHEENGVTTTRTFPDDLIFAYQIAINAIYEETSGENPKYTIQADENSAVVTFNL